MLHYNLQYLHECFRVALTKARALQVTSSYHRCPFRFVSDARNQREDQSSVFRGHSFFGQPH